MLAQPPLIIVQFGGGPRGDQSKAAEPAGELAGPDVLPMAIALGTELIWGLPSQLRAVFQLLFYPVSSLFPEVLKEEKVPLRGFGPEGLDTSLDEKANGPPNPSSGSVT